jgi:phosphopantothenoylcysteine synthetase/decarboxylase
MKIASRPVTRARSARLSPEIMASATSTDLTKLVRRLIDDPSTSTAVRNECHRLLIAIDQNQRELIDERLDRLTQLLDAAASKTSR